MRTILGWTVYGKLSGDNEKHHSMIVYEEVPVRKIVDDQLSLQNIGIKQVSESSMPIEEKHDDTSEWDIPIPLNMKKHKEREKTIEHPECTGDNRFWNWWKLFFHISMMFKIIQFDLKRSIFSIAFTLGDRLETENIIYRKAENDEYLVKIKDLKNNKIITTFWQIVVRTR